MKHKPLNLFSGVPLSGAVLRTLIHTGRVVGDAAGTGIGVGIKMSLGMVLASLMPQLCLAQDEPSASRQPVKHSRRADQSQKLEDKVQNVTMASGAHALDLSKTGLKSVEVVDVMPKLNVKRLSAEELRELRQQLLGQR